MADYAVDNNPDSFAGNMKEFEWTTTPPTEPGWYQVPFEGGIVFVEVREYINKLVVWATGDDSPDEFSDYSHWLGPIPLAEPPK